MWLFTSTGFVSVVADKEEPVHGDLLVRSREKQHIESLFPDAEVFSTQPSDYQWRAWVSRSEVACALVKQVENLSYTNFKNSIVHYEDDRYHEACMNVWGVMYSSFSD